jgi:hypothetical protein
MQLSLDTMQYGYKRNLNNGCFRIWKSINVKFLITLFYCISKIMFIFYKELLLHDNYLRLHEFATTKASHMPSVRTMLLQIDIKRWGRCMDSIFIFIGVECTQLLFQNGPIFCHNHGLFLRKSKKHILY